MSAQKNRWKNKRFFGTWALWVVQSKSTAAFFHSREICFVNSLKRLVSWYKLCNLLFGFFPKFGELGIRYFFIVVVPEMEDDSLKAKWKLNIQLETCREEMKENTRVVDVFSTHINRFVRKSVIGGQVHCLKSTNHLLFVLEKLTNSDICQKWSAPTFGQCCSARLSSCWNLRK